ncbi:unnamed protein product [Bemisia tabaci]|uniref:YqaJ viral recombinase domain-containing protein n=1 Tax=Bemisia tabaci TaxID=7038 RepID=A0A9P0AIM1_BEMTA|nr:unnamed protein product [Bemisia tabaci]
MTEEDCEKLAKMTKAQADSPLWDDARFGRVSASKVWEASRCQKGDGCLKNRVLGGGKFKATSAMERGTNLEKDVLKQVQKQFPGHRMKKTGFKVLQTQPIFGASPDGILGDYIVEVKCPSKAETYSSYFTSNYSQPANKYKGQMHLQMLACGKKKGLFCVASPNFKENKAVKILRVSFDRCFSNQMMRASKEFWILNIYPILYANY